MDSCPPDSDASRWHFGPPNDEFGPGSKETDEKVEDGKDGAGPFGIQSGKTLRDNLAYYFDKGLLLYLANAIGYPLMLHVSTTTLSHPSVARIYRDVDVLDNHPKWIQIDENDFHFCKPITYENMYCSYCDSLDHSLEHCKPIHDKYAGSSQLDQDAIDKFVKVLIICGLKEVKFSGNSFNLNGTRNGTLVWKRLDRVLMNTAWEVSFPECFVSHLVGTFWDLPIAGNPFVTLVVKLKMLKHVLREWKKTTFYNIFQNLKKAENQSLEVAFTAGLVPDEGSCFVSFTTPEISGSDTVHHALINKRLVNEVGKRRKIDNKGLSRLKKIPKKPLVLPSTLDCEYCGAKRFHLEPPNFGCSGGQVSLVIPSMPYDLLRLYPDLSEESLDFKNNVCTYNNSLAFTSLGAKYDHELTKNSKVVYTFLFKDKISSKDIGTWHVKNVFALEAKPRCRFDVNLTSDYGTIIASVFADLGEALLRFSAFEAMKSFVQNKNQMQILFIIVPTENLATPSQTANFLLRCRFSEECTSSRVQICLSKNFDAIEVAKPSKKDASEDHESSKKKKAKLT
ncbi:hypothetical protein ACH5RR_013047 [Cinchona calisaya]|uniref:Uncharacterized protein n=1 Tax=Cinchona calisaya TaxID=153742 RepID=A0ABD2ZYY0_9GENT